MMNMMQALRFLMTIKMEMQFFKLILMLTDFNKIKIIFKNNIINFILKKNLQA